MTTYLPRDAWTTTGPRKTIRLDPARVVGLAVHWPGTSAPIGDPGQHSIAVRLEGYRRFHVNTRRWFDIAYQVAIDQAGRVWDLRGVEVESGANGSHDTNVAYGALLLLLGPGEQPSPAMLGAVADWHRDRWLAAFPNATKVVGHGDIRPDPTACPGPIVSGLVHAGQLIGAAVTPAPVAAAPVRPAPQPTDLTGTDAGSPAVKLIDLRNAHRSYVRSPGVAPLQRLLGVKADGVGGPDTRNALGAAQTRVGVARDYIFGPNTASALLAGK